MRGMGVGMGGIRVGMRRIGVGMRRIGVGMRGIRVGMRGIGVGMREWNGIEIEKNEEIFVKSKFLFFLKLKKNEIRIVIKP